jgi:imidazolonepropionase-like amidohydrolase
MISSRYELTNFRLFDGQHPVLIDGMNMVVESGRIGSIGPSSLDARESFGDSIDLGGRTVIPGLMNLHEHITWRRGTDSFEARAVRKPVGRLLLRGMAHALISLAEGVTTIRDCASRDGSALLLRDAITEGEALGPRIHSVGAAIAMTGGHGSGAVLNADGPDEIRKAVREQLHKGADWIKLMASGGYLEPNIDQPTSQQFSAEEMAAAFDEAHRAGKRTTVHAHPAKAVRTAINAGVDCIEHAGLVDQATVELIAARNVFVDPTLCSPRYDVAIADRAGLSDWLVEASRAHLAEQAQIFTWLREAKCKIVAGTDASGDIQSELEYMVELGMPPHEAIRTATAVAAECLGVFDDLGTLEPGKIADFVVLDGDPLKDIRALRSVFATVKDGIVYWPKIIRHSTGVSIVSEIIDESRDAQASMVSWKLANA